MILGQRILFCDFRHGFRKEIAAHEHVAVTLGQGIEKSVDQIHKILLSPLVLQGVVRGRDLTDLVKSDLDLSASAFFAACSLVFVKRFGTSQNNVLKILSRTRQKLKNYLDREWTTL